MHTEQNRSQQTTTKQHLRLAMRVIRAQQEELAAYRKVIAHHLVQGLALTGPAVGRRTSMQHAS